MNYISNTPQEQKDMLNNIGVEKIEDLFSIIPQEVLETEPLKVDGGLSELEIWNKVQKEKEKNVSLGKCISFLGGGAYDHYIPSIINHIISRSEYYTAYTPYQAELSQGTLQSIFEYQSMICELTGMDIANASLLDGGSALGEAVSMAKRITGKSEIIMSEGIHPVYRKIAETYGIPQKINFRYLKMNNKYTTDFNFLKEKINNNTGALVLQYPNFYGSIEKLYKFKEILTKIDSEILLIIISNPITLGVLKPPGKFDADIVIGEGQPLGNSINYGGPYLGYMAVRNNRKFLREMPGRLAGATQDQEGNTGYVLTLQTREQHIRREKATSNICTNEALNTLIAAIYMSVMGKKGIKESAIQCTKKAHYLAEKIDKINGYEVLNKNNFFHEFIVKCPVATSSLIDKLEKKNILPGINLERFKETEGLLVCVTEKRTKKDMDDFVNELEDLK
ncbi:MAG: aminomethyl-transferring glycine dehydrogenase subunit GcvPA [Bacillota bacterium]